MLHSRRRGEGGLCGTMPLQCPACENRLSRVDYGGVAVGACDSCKGSWLTGSGFASITQMDGAGFSPRDVAKLKIKSGLWGSLSGALAAGVAMTLESIKGKFS